MTSVPALSEVRGISADDVEALAVGATTLGAGGGGSTSLVATWLRWSLGAEGTVEVVGLDSPPGWMIPIGIVGAADVLVESLPSGREMPRAVERMAELTGVEPAALLPLEIGGQNGLAAVIAARECGLPLADGDLMGRAFPRLDHFTPAVAGWRYSPVVSCTNSGTTLVVEPARPSEVEDVLRAAMANSHGWAAFALPPVHTGTVEALGEGVIAGSVTRVVSLGRDLLAAARGRSHPVDGVEEVLLEHGGRVLGRGRVVDIHRFDDPERRARSGITLAVHGSSTTLRLELGSEFLVAIADGEVVATGPDVICVFSGVDGRPLLGSELRSGTSVVVGVLPSAEFWTRPGNLPVVAPRAFGVDVDPVLLSSAPTSGRVL
jgi:DUF917 family protein